MAVGALAKNLIAEFIGTYILVFTVGCNVLCGSPVWGVLSIASSLMVSIYAMGSISGGHFNPAVSLAIYLAGAEKSVTKTLSYIAVQLTAGVVAGQVYGLILFDKSIPLGPGSVDADGKTKFGMASVACIEILYTFVLSFVVLRAAVKTSELQKECETFALAIGWCVVVGGYAGGWVSGGCFNPAVACGIGFGSSSFVNMGMYTAFELVGGVIAACLHTVLEGSMGDVAKKCLSEFVGVFVLVATVGLSVLCPSHSAGALPIGASLMVMIYAMGMVSGGHFNPAVSISCAMSRKLELSLLPMYVASQIFGGIAGAFAFKGITGKYVELGPQKDKDGRLYSWTAVALAEITYTFVLCFVILNVATLVDKDRSGKTIYMLEGGKAQQIYGLAIGFCVIVGGFAIGGVSGGSLNPAVSIGLDLSSTITGTCGLYSIVEIIGGVLASCAFYVLRDEQFSGEGYPLKKDDPEGDYGATV